VRIEGGHLSSMVSLFQRHMRGGSSNHIFGDTDICQYGCRLSRHGRQSIDSLLWLEPDPDTLPGDGREVGKHKRPQSSIISATI